MLARATAVAQQQVRAKDAEIAAAVRQVSAENLRASIERLVSFGTRHTSSAASPAAVNSGHGIGAARVWIEGEFARISRECGGCLEVKADRFVEGPAPRLPQPTEIVNVYAVLRGTDPANLQRMYVVSGHYDSRAGEANDAISPAPGANDDGSGTALVLEAARVLSRHRFPATIVFLTVAGEERGLNGARHFAKLAHDEHWQIEAVLNDDTVGGDRTAGQDFGVLRVFSEGTPLAASESELRQIRSLGGENDSPSRELARYVDETARTYLPKTLQARLIFRPDRFLRGGDHLAFNEEGFAAVRLTEWRENYDHQHQNLRNENGIEYGDLPKFVNYEYLANVARLNIATLASLASAPAPPANVRIDTRELTNNTTLTWEGPPAGYEVVWRETTAPDWQHAQPVVHGNRADLQLAKDNVIFAVRSIDASGHRSLPVVPRPLR